MKLLEAIRNKLKQFACNHEWIGEGEVNIVETMNGPTSIPAKYVRSVCKCKKCGAKTVNYILLGSHGL